MQDKLKLRLKTLEEGLKQTASNNVNPKVLNGFSKPEKANHFFGILSSNAVTKKRSTSQPRPSMINRSSEQESAENSGEPKQNNDQKKRHGLWYSRNKIDDNGEKENAGMKENSDKLNCPEITDSGNFNTKSRDYELTINDDMVSGFLYDRLQKEVINMRKCFDMKESALSAKDEEIKVKYQ